MIVLLSLTAWAEQPCTTMQRWNRWQPRHLMQVEWKSERIHHDIYDTPLEQVAFSEHFALHWGASYTDLERVEDLLVLLEESLRTEVESVGMPTVASGYYFNVYLGSTGESMPDSLNVAGYYDVDSTGHPMIVLGEFVTSSWSIAKTTVPHELFHALQHRTSQYGQFQDRWYWEATATWSEQVVLPGHPSHADFLYGYALLPHLPLTHYSLFGAGALDELHPYGAFIVFQYMTENLVGLSDVGSSWTQDNLETPILWWDDHLQTLDTTLGDVMSQVSAHNVTWDYEEQLIYETQVQAQIDANPELDQRMVGELSLDLQNQEITVPSSLRPGGLGYNIWNVDTNASEMRLQFDGVTIGDHFGQVDWKVSVVRTLNNNVQRDFYSAEGGELEIDLFDVQLYDDIVITVTASSLDFHAEERFTYSWSVESIEEPKVSACSQVPVFQPLWMLLVFGWVPFWRRQEHHSSPVR